VSAKRDQELYIQLISGILFDFVASRIANTDFSCIDFDWDQWMSVGATHALCDEAQSTTSNFSSTLFSNLFLQLSRFSVVTLSRMCPDRHVHCARITNKRVAPQSQKYRRVCAHVCVYAFRGETYNEWSRDESGRWIQRTWDYAMHTFVRWSPQLYAEFVRSARACFEPIAKPAHRETAPRWAGRHTVNAVQCIVQHNIDVTAGC
jgi:hypothetical protein